MFQTISKQIRDLLRIRRNVQSFNPYKLRKSYLSLTHKSGKYHPHLTYRQHAEMAESIANSRLAYFRKKNMYYSGWSMEPWWDSKLREEEKRMKEYAKYSPDKEDEKKMTIGHSIQERLYGAAKREMSIYEPKPKKIFTDHPLMDCPLFVKTLPQKNKAESQIIGHLNWSPVELRRNPAIVTVKVMPKHRGCPPPYLPIIFYWKEMEMSKGFEQSRIEKKHKCGYYQV